MDHFVEVERVSWFKRFRNALLGLIFAPVFVVVAFFILRHGEIEHAMTTKALFNIEDKVLAQPTDNSLCLAYDSLYSDSSLLVDPLVSLKINSLKLFRDIQTWQWNEIKKTKEVHMPDGSTVKKTEYTYKQGWYTYLINSDYFKHKEGHINPKKRRFPHYKTEKETFHFGEKILDSRFNEYILDYIPLDIVNMNLSLQKNMRITKGEIPCLGKPICYPNSEPQKVMSSGGASLSEARSIIPFSKASFSGGEFFGSYILVSEGSSTAPQIGDTRIMYWHIPNSRYTIIGEHNGNKIAPYTKDSLFIHSELPCEGLINSKLGQFGMIFSGEHTKEEMFTTVHHENDFMFMILRIGGLLFMIGGFALFGNPLGVLLSWLPFVGAIWEKLIFKLMMLLGSIATISISSFYFLKHNSISNLTIFDLYFVVIVILILLFSYSLKVSYGSYSEEF